MENIIYQGSALFKGNNMCGFVKDMTYNIEIKKNLYGYIVTAEKMRKEDPNLYITYSSRNSIHHYWDLSDSFLDE